MSLSSQQLQAFYVPGMIALPVPFPEVGRIAFETWDVFYPPNNRQDNLDLVVVRQESPNSGVVLRAVQPETVSAVFVPDNPDDEFELDEGKWFYRPNVNVGDIAAATNIAQNDLRKASSPLQGIVFVPEHTPVFNRIELVRRRVNAAIIPIARIQVAIRVRVRITTSIHR